MHGTLPERLSKLTADNIFDKIQYYNCFYHEDTKTQRKKMRYRKLTEREEEIAKIIVDCAYKVHLTLGPGLLESIYETCFCYD